MNDDVLDLLRAADPAGGHQGYSAARLDEQLARLREAGGDADPGAAWPPRRGRRAGVAAIAFVAAGAAGLGSAAAAGWLSPQVHQVFDAPAQRQMLIDLYGSAADLSGARERVSAPGPDGSTVAVWTVPVGEHQLCSAILVSKKSAKLPPDSATVLPQNVPCQAVAPGADPTFDSQSVLWRSPRTGVTFTLFAGSLGRSASRAQVSLADGAVEHAITGNGFYLLPPLPADLTCARLVATDSQGKQARSDQFLSVGCPGDPTKPGASAPLPSPSSTVTTHHDQAVDWTATVMVNVAALIRQDPRWGVGSAAPGTSLITVRLQFQQNSTQPTTLPSSASFDLLYGPQHTVATRDPGKDHDAELNSPWHWPGPSPLASWLPQQSFDVPTAQLNNLQVRLNGDAIHATVLFTDAQGAF
ncbi:MAG: hypothetical protein ACR2N4_09735 [Jatrophihabitans sp.]